ncbi:MAG TPA: RNA polymerase sigma factor SigZ [Cyclobacteriaceae bacterium]|nr:RNA polymerase sigma factor SigZ [Cyclobacteriaceae bacterium]
MEIKEIYIQFQGALLAFIQSKVKSKQDAEDILHSVFIKISNSIHKLSDQNKLQAWIFTITRNAVMDYYRMGSAAKIQTIDDKDFIGIIEEEFTDVTKGIDNCIHGMIDQLPEEYKNIIIDSELKGVKQKDLAEKYSMAYSSLRSRVQRGRDRLKQLLLNCCHIEADVYGNIIETRDKNNCEDSCQSCKE